MIYHAQDGLVNATPSKRIYLSIIADYDINKALCELIDNAIDIWKKYSIKKQVHIDIELDSNQQRIKVFDDAGGLKKEELSNIVGPGHTGNVGDIDTIGIFGVGTKRAVVALAQDITITTRSSNGNTYKISFDDDWLNKSDDWYLPIYKDSNITSGSTVIELLQLRTVLTSEIIDNLRIHIGKTYALFLATGQIVITINGEPVSAYKFDNWAYPPSFEPIEYTGKIHTDVGDVSIKAIAGLTLESSPAGGEYGVYIYCNDRLIAQGLKTYNVGYGAGLAGKPHADISLVRVFLYINGPAQLMPWNSSKSGINPSNLIFKNIRQWLINVVKDYSSLSRKLSKVPGGWKENVFPFTSGEIKNVSVSSFADVRKSYLPPLPVIQPRYKNKIIQNNEILAKKKPWTIGLYESLIVVNWLLRQDLTQKNRMALVLLDSTLEIAFKEFLLNESGQQYNQQRFSNLFNNRSSVQIEIQKYTTFSADFWKKVQYYYQIRCDLIHKKASSSIPDVEIIDFRQLVEEALSEMFGLKF